MAPDRAPLSPGLPSPARAALLVVMSLVVVGSATAPVWDTGFLADDWFLGVRTLQHRERATDPIDFAHRLCVPRWTPDYDMFRPLGILIAHATWSGLGADARAHHMMGWALWLCVSLLAGRVIAQSLDHRGGTWALGTLVFGVWPAAIESLGWAAAHQDLWCLLFTLLAVLAATGRRFRVGWSLWWCACAMLCKETGVLAPLLVAWVDLTRAGSQRPPLVLGLRRHAPVLGLIPLYLAVRWALFGRLTGRYQGVDYGDSLLGSGDAWLTRLGSALERLVAPVNESAADRMLGGFAAVAPMGTLVVVGLLVLVGAYLGTGRMQWRSVLIGAPWIAGPLVLLVMAVPPIGPDLDQTRILLFPLMGFAWLMAASLAQRRSNPTRPRATRRARATAWAVAVFVLVGFSLWRMNLTAYAKATSAQERIVASLTEDLEPGHRVLLFDALAGDGTAVHPTLSKLEGCHLLSDGIRFCTLPPFFPGVGAPIVLMHEGTDLATVVAERPEAPLPRLARYDADTRQFTTVARETWRHHALTVSPATGHPAGAAVTALSVTGPIADWQQADRVVFKLFEPSGFAAQGQGPVLADRGVGRAQVAVDALEVLVDGEPNGMRLSAPVLASLPRGCFVWWVEGMRGRRVVVRTPYQVIAVPGPR